MKRVYCDNSSTSFPKAPGLGAAMANHIDHFGYNISRGGYRAAYNVESAVIETKDAFCRLLNFDDAGNIVFTPGATVGLNMVIKGFLKPDDHMITTSMEHNSVVRPAAQLVEQGVEWDEAPCDEEGSLHIAQLEALMRPNTKLVMMTHASNVCGTVIPIAQVGALCKRHGVRFVVDGAQTVGSMPVDVKAANIDAIVFAGHKGMLGPQGIGVIGISREMAKEVQPLIAGGTGSASDLEQMPDFLPDKFQPGTMNIPGIIGLKHSLAFIEAEGIPSMKEKKLFLTACFIEKVKNMNGVRLIGKQTLEDRCAVVSLDFLKVDNAEADFLLENRFGIQTRCGLHCAPHAHRTLNTFPLGTLRFSFGYFNEPEEVDYVADAIAKILKGNV